MNGDATPKQVRDLLFPHSKLLGFVFAMSPFKLWFVLSVAGCVGILLPARLIGVGKIVCNAAAEGQGYNCGLLSLTNWNWSLMMPLGLPLLIAFAAWLLQRTHPALEKLLANKPAVLLARNGGERAARELYLGTFRVETEKLTRLIVPAALVLTVLLSVLDTANIVHGSWVISSDRAPCFREWDWSVAYAANDIGRRCTNDAQMPMPPTSFAPEKTVTKTENLTFDIVAYCFQGTYIFLGLSFVATFWVFLHAFTNLMVPSEFGPCYGLGTKIKERWLTSARWLRSRLFTKHMGDRQSPVELTREVKNQFVFDPWWADIDHRMGLDMMGTLYNRFLEVGIGFESYVFIHRLQLIVRQNHEQYPTILTYYQDVWSAGWIGVIQRAATLGQWNSFNKGMFLLLVGVVIPFAVIAWWPLLRIRPFVLQKRKDAKAQYGEEFARAQDAGETDAAKLSRIRIKQIDSSCVWPNGDWGMGTTFYYGFTYSSQFLPAESGGLVRDRCVGGPCCNNRPIVN